MNAATHPRRRESKLLVVDENGVSHHRRADLPLFLRPHDLVIANDAATLPASLSGTHLKTGAAIEVRLAGRRSLSPESVRCFTCVVFGDGDYRTPTEHRPSPPMLAPGDTLVLGPLRATVAGTLGHPRLVELQFDGSIDAIWEGLAHGRPIQYAYVPEPLAIWDTWTPVAALPAAFESPSAGFVLDWSMVGAIRARGAHFATLTHAAGISSTGDPELDRRLPLDEPYIVPAHTAALVAAARANGGRVIAIGTTVVRALEDAAGADGHVTAGAGVAARRIGPGSRLRVVDALVSGMHERGTSHYELMRALVDDAVLSAMIAEAERRDYQAHEFGDAVFVVRRRLDVALGRLTGEGREDVATFSDPLSDLDLARELRVVLEERLLA